MITYEIDYLFVKKSSIHLKSKNRQHIFDDYQLYLTTFYISFKY